MTIASIGDIHGRPIWKIFLFGSYEGYEAWRNGSTEIFPIDAFDIVVFIGDYVDSFDVSNVEIKGNLLDIIHLRNTLPHKIKLLIGNHDHAYMIHPPDVQISGFRPEIALDLNQIFRENLSIFDAAYQYKNTIWTHAGIHEGWWKVYASRDIRDLEGKYKRIFGEPTSDMSIADIINNLYLINAPSIHMISFHRSTYGKKVGGPLWADKIETSKKPLKGYDQIIGHTPVKRMLEMLKLNKKTKELISLSYIDCLGGDEPLIKIKTY